MTAQTNTVAAKLFAADARCIKAAIAYSNRLVRELVKLPAGCWPRDAHWKEAIEEADADECRHQIEQSALASGDPALIEIVIKRRERDGDQLVITAKAA